MITQPIQTQRALLAWQRPLAERGARRRYAVAELLQQGRDVSFAYRQDSEDLGAALDAGFRGYPGLPLHFCGGGRTAFDVLRRRLPPSTREDFPEFLEGFGLSPEMGLSDLSQLAYTGAYLTGDSFGIVETFDGFSAPFRYVFDVAGYRWYRHDAPDLAVGEPISFRPNPTNPHDPCAVEVLCRTDIRIGHINRLQTGPVRAWLTDGTITAQVFRQNGRAAYPRLFVMAEVIPHCRSGEAA